jgi:hypothetical protein
MSDDWTTPYRAARPPVLILAQKDHPHEPAEKEHRNRREEDKPSSATRMVIKKEHNPGEPSYRLYNRTQNSLSHRSRQPSIAAAAALPSAIIRSFAARDFDALSRR